MRGTAGEVTTNWLAALSYELLHIGAPVLAWLTNSKIYQLSTDPGCSLEDLLWAMASRNGWWERVREHRAIGVTWWCRRESSPKHEYQKKSGCQNWIPKYSSLSAELDSLNLSICGVTVIVVWSGIGSLSSNPERDYLPKGSSIIRIWYKVNS